MESAFRNSPLFQPTPPARTETLLLSLSKGIREYFNPLRPRGRRRCSGRNKETSYINFNPLRPRGRRPYRCLQISNNEISTHSAREDGDCQFCDSHNQRTISTHSAREDGDLFRLHALYIFYKFQPTPPARTETEKADILAVVMPDFNPLRPRGRRQQYYTKKPTILHHISTIKSHHTPSNHRQPTLHTSKTVLIVQFFRCESPRKFMFASGSHQTI